MVTAQQGEYPYDEHIICSFQGEGAPQTHGSGAASQWEVASGLEEWSRPLTSDGARSMTGTAPGCISLDGDVALVCAVPFAKSFKKNLCGLLRSLASNAGGSNKLPNEDIDALFNLDEELLAGMVLSETETRLKKEVRKKFPPPPGSCEKSD
eukprot:9476808-Pyramimonas_sp.AAC.1